MASRWGRTSDSKRVGVLVASRMSGAPTALPRTDAGERWFAAADNFGVRDTWNGYPACWAGVVELDFSQFTNRKPPGASNFGSPGPGRIWS